MNLRQFVVLATLLLLGQYCLGINEEEFHLRQAMMYEGDCDCRFFENRMKIMQKFSAVDEVMRTMNRIIPLYSFRPPEEVALIYQDLNSISINSPMTIHFWDNLIAKSFNVTCRRPAYLLELRNLAHTGKRRVNEFISLLRSLVSSRQLFQMLDCENKSHEIDWAGSNLFKITQEEWDNFNNYDASIIERVQTEYAIEVPNMYSRMIKKQEALQEFRDKSANFDPDDIFSVMKDANNFRQLKEDTEYKSWQNIDFAVQATILNDAIKNESDAIRHLFRRPALSLLTVYEKLTTISYQKCIALQNSPRASTSSAPQS